MEIESFRLKRVITSVRLLLSNDSTTESPIFDKLKEQTDITKQSETLARTPVRVLQENVS